MSASESFVDLSYRGFEVGRHLRISEFGPTTAYVEHPTPLPVGTSLELAIEEGGPISATVLRVHEQVAGAERAPGMHVRVVELSGAAATWWADRISSGDPQIPEIFVPPSPTPDADAVPEIDTDVAAELPPLDASMDGAVAQPIHDVTEREAVPPPTDGEAGRDTQVMEIIKREELRAQAQRLGAERRSTVIMSAQEIRDVIGQDPEDGEPSEDTGEGYVEGDTDPGNGEGNGDSRAKPSGKRRAKRGGRRRKR